MIYQSDSLSLARRFKKGLGWVSRLDNLSFNAISSLFSVLVLALPV